MGFSLGLKCNGAAKPSGQHRFSSSPFASGSRPAKMFIERSAVPARLGLKAPALAWPKTALAFAIHRPGQSRQLGLGPGLAWPGPRLCMQEF
jgi:hypothetical protein